MVKFISEVSRELGISHHLLRNWEAKGLLGDVQKDFVHGRMYTEDQIERIKAIQEVVKEQQAKGLKRTDFRAVENVLLEKFGGMVEPVPQTIPATPEAFTNMLLMFEKQNQEMQVLKKMMLDLTKKIETGLPESTDYSQDLNKITEGMMTKAQGEELISRLAEEEKEKSDMKREVELLQEKLDTALNYIKNQEEAEEKKGFWKKFSRR